MDSADLLEQHDIPSWARWLAQDEDGSWWIYEAEPLQQHTGWYENEVGRRRFIIKTGANPDWQSTLTRIELI